MGGSELTRPELFVDNAHPNDLGYKVMAETVYAAINKDRY